MKPIVSHLSRFDVYRDGGSVSASFFDPSGNEYMLRFPVILVSSSSGPKRVGYGEPIVEHFVPSQRTSPITGITHTSWDSEQSPTSWQEARQLLVEMQPFVDGFLTEYQDVYPKMVKIAAAGGVE
ncbi:hypothetical protein ACO0K9_02250 [Undibacterium sp. Ji50W]|uniref:hypothetical protein n=1 Tax=Undibacterium sp. Ji50W TaxID=3413041 RepID=UPI003BF32C6D